MMLFAFVLVMAFLFAAIALFSSRCLRSRSPMQLKSSHRQSKSDNGRMRTKRVGAFVAAVGPFDLTHLVEDDNMHMITNVHKDLYT